MAGRGEKYILMNTKLNFGFLYRKKNFEENSFKLKSIFSNKQLRPALTILTFTLKESGMKMKI